MAVYNCEGGCGRKNLERNQVRIKHNGIVLCKAECAPREDNTTQAEYIHTHRSEWNAYQRDRYHAKKK